MRFVLAQVRHSLRVVRLAAWIIVTAITVFSASATAAPSSEAAPATSHAATEVLVLPGGDRLAGHLVRRDGETIVFHSVHLGELRVPAATARIVPSGFVSAAVVSEPLPSSAPANPSPADPPVPATDAPATASAAKRSSWWTPAALTDNVMGFLGPWKGRLAVALSLSEGSGRGENFGADLSFSRKWATDEVRFETHYTLAATEDVVKTDMLKANGLYRHDFKGPVFVNFRPAFEWNRNHFIDGQPADYVLGQHSLGLGINVLDLPGRKIGLGVAENIFDVWTLEDDQHSTRDAQSVFGEIELQFPWRVSLTGRATWFYNASNGDSGWEDQFEITKKFSDTLSLGLRREARHNNPDPRIADYSLLRLQLGLDF